MKTKQVINTYGLQHFKQYVYRGVEQKENVLEPWHTVTRVVSRDDLGNALMLRTWV